MIKGGTVYIITNHTHSVLYTGVTANLNRRILEHKKKQNPGSFSARYNAKKLVYFKRFPTINEAIAEEKRIKSGNRKQKCILIESINPNWINLLE